MGKSIISYLAVCALCILHSCAGPDTEKQPASAGDVEPAAAHRRDITMGETRVDVTHLASRGRIRSRNIVTVSTPADGFVREISLYEGQAVRKGQTLVRLDDSELKMEISLLEAELEKKRFDVENTLIGMGYSRKEFDSLPESTIRNVKVMTGYEYTLLNLQNQRNRLEMYDIKAPISGKILNIGTHLHAFAGRGDILCRILDPDNLSIEFKVLESNLALYRIGMEVEFSTISSSDGLHKARLVSIAPNVEEDGMVLMSADVTSDSSGLIPGMAVMVNIPSAYEIQ